jgi:hypothetical protein
MSTISKRQPKLSVTGKGSTQLSSHARSYVQDSLDDLFAVFTQCRPAEGPRGGARIDSDELRELLGVYSRLHKMADALFIWHTSADFADKEGRPKNLPRGGRVSLTSLAMRVTRSRRDASRIVSDLIDMSILLEDETTFSPRQRSAVLRTDNAVASAYAAVTLSRLIRTMRHNFAEAGPPRFERSLSDVNIPESDLPLFYAFVREQGEYFIDAVDDWLAQRPGSRPRHIKTVSVGVGAFSWVEPPARAQPRPRSSRDRSPASETI